MNSKNILENLKIMVQVPDLASKRWVFEQYDSQVMNNTIQIGGDAAIVRVEGTNKALALTCDCTPRYVEADPFEGAKQAVAETYRNISAVGGRPMAITNCLNFGNPQKPEIMGQIVRAIKGINEACLVLDYPVVSGNVSLYNETDGKAIQPTPNIGGVGLLKDLSKRSDIKFKATGDSVFLIGDSFGHIGSSLFEREILKIEQKNPPPSVDLVLEKKHGEFVRMLIESSIINACHDISDGGILMAIFEMCNDNLGVKLDFSELKVRLSTKLDNFDFNYLLFGEDQARYLVTVENSKIENFLNLAFSNKISLFQVGEVIADKIAIGDSSLLVKELKTLNELVFPQKFN